MESSSCSSSPSSPVSPLTPAPTVPINPWKRTSALPAEKPAAVVLHEATDWPSLSSSARPKKNDSATKQGMEEDKPEKQPEESTMACTSTMSAAEVLQVPPATSAPPQTLRRPPNLPAYQQQQSQSFPSNNSCGPRSNNRPQHVSHHGFNGFQHQGFPESQYHAQHHFFYTPPPPHVMPQRTEVFWPVYNQVPPWRPPLLPPSSYARPMYPDMAQTHPPTPPAYALMLPVARPPLRPPTYHIPRPRRHHRPAHAPSPQLSPPPPPTKPMPGSPEYLTLVTRAQRQIEYYFSDNNLRSDRHTRELMDKEGWVDLKEIASYRIIADLTDDIKLVYEAVSSSEILEARELNTQGYQVRRNEWERWVPEAQQAQ